MVQGCLLSFDDNLGPAVMICVSNPSTAPSVRLSSDCTATPTQHAPIDIVLFGKQPQVSPPAAWRPSRPLPRRLSISPVPRRSRPGEVGSCHRRPYHPLSSRATRGRDVARAARAADGGTCPQPAGLKIARAADRSARYTDSMERDQHHRRLRARTLTNTSRLV